MRIHLHICIFRNNQIQKKKKHKKTIVRTPSYIQFDASKMMKGKKGTKKKEKEKYSFIKVPLV